jgi:hypothetical protein
MQSLLLIILAIIALGSIYVVLPVVADAYGRYRNSRKPVCPETGLPAEVLLDARRAAATAAFGKSELRVRQCSRWPEHRDCDQGCTQGIG